MEGDKRLVAIEELGTCVENRKVSVGWQMEFGVTQFTDVDGAMVDTDELLWLNKIHKMIVMESNILLLG